MTDVTESVTTATLANLANCACPHEGTQGAIFLREVWSEFRDTVDAGVERDDINKWGDDLLCRMLDEHCEPRELWEAFGDLHGWDEFLYNEFSQNVTMRDMDDNLSLTPVPTNALYWIGQRLLVALDEMYR